MKKRLWKLLGIDMLRDNLHVLMSSSLELEEKVTEQNNALFALGEKLDRLEVSTKRTHVLLAQIDGRCTRIEHELGKAVYTPEENDIEKHAEAEEIEVTDGMHVPIVQGMKVRFETEGVETDIHIE